MNTVNIRQCNLYYSEPVPARASSENQNWPQEKDPFVNADNVATRPREEPFDNLLMFLF